MVCIEKERLDLEKIAESGQCFRMSRIEGETGRWRIQAADKFLFARESAGETMLDCSRDEFDAFWKDYFDLERDYESIVAEIDPGDAFLTAAAEYSRGIRILRQDPWEMLISFIISQRKSIPAIRVCVEKLSEAFGKKLPQGLHAFPKPEELAAAGAEGLATCSLGYRLPYVLAAAERAAGGEADIYSWKKLPNEELTENLLSFPGVGPKVANCVMLFGYGRIDAFPVDVWIRRVIDEKYAGRFDPSRYSGFAGIIQQYMFYYGRGKL